MPMRSNTYSTSSFEDYMDAGSSSVDTGLADSLYSGAAEGLLDTPTTSLLYNKAYAPPLAERTITPGSPARAPGRQQFLSQEELSKQTPGEILYEDAVELRKDFPQVPYDKGMTRSRAKYIDDQMTTSQARAKLTENRPISNTIAKFAAGIPDVTNFIPVFGEIGAAANVGSRILKFAIPYGRSAAENVVNIGVADAVTMGSREQYGREVSIQDDVTLGALFGLTIHGAGDTIKFGYGKLKGKAKITPAIPDAPKVEPVPEVIPALKTEPNITSEDGVTATYLDPVPVTVNSQKNVIASRIIVNDAIYGLSQGTDIKLGDASKAAITEMGPYVVRAAEVDKYHLTKSPETASRELELRQQIEYQRVIASESAKGQGFASLESEGKLTQLSIELANLRAKHAGYITEPPPVLDGINYDLVVNHTVLPEQIRNILKPEVIKQFNQLSKDMIGGMESDRWELKKLLATHVSPLYAGVYGRLYHGTPKDFMNFDNKKLGTGAGGNDASYGHFLANKPTTSNAYTGHIDEDSPHNPTPQNMLVNAELRNPYVIDFEGGHYTASGFSEILGEAVNKGHDGAILLNVRDGGPKDNVYIVFDGNKISPAIQPQKDISWAEPKVEYGSMFIQEQAPLIEKLITSSPEVDKFLAEAKAKGFDLENEATTITPEDQLNIDILKASMTPEEIAAFDAELKTYDDELGTTNLENTSENKYAFCRSV